MLTRCQPPSRRKPQSGEGRNDSETSAAREPMLVTSFAKTDSEDRTQST